MTVPSCVDCRHSRRESDHTDRNLVCSHPLGKGSILGPRVPECGPGAKLFQVRPQVPDSVKLLVCEVGERVEILRAANLVTEREADEVANLLFRCRVRAVDQAIEAEDHAAWIASLPGGRLDFGKLLRESIANAEHTT